MRAAWIVTGVVILLTCAGCSLKYMSDEGAWQKEQDALIRLRSGIKFESVLMLRSRLADADAASEDYGSRWRLFPLHHRERLQFARKAVSSFSNALDWSGKANSDMNLDTNPADAVILERDPEITTFIPRSCNNGNLAFDPQAAGAAWVVYGNYWVGLAEGSQGKEPRGSEPPLNADRELEGCQEKQIEIEKAQRDALTAKADALRAASVAAARAEQAREAASAKAMRDEFLAKWPYQVQFVSHTACSFVLYIDRSSGSVINVSSQPASFRMHDSMVLEHAKCNMIQIPTQNILITLNGTPYSAKWERENVSGTDDIPSFRTEIVPKSNP